MLLSPKRARVSFCCLLAYWCLFFFLFQRFSATQPLTTALISVPDTVELAVRICRILVIRLGRVVGPRAVYVGCSVVGDGVGDWVREGVGVVECVVEEVGRLVARGQRRGDGAREAG